MTHPANERYYGTRAGVNECLYDIDKVLGDYAAFVVVNGMFPEPGPNDELIVWSLLDDNDASQMREESLPKRAISRLGLAAMDLADKAVRIAVPR